MKITYTIQATEAGYKLTDNYGTGYGAYKTEAEAQALVAAWTGEPWENKEEPKHEFNERMYGAPAVDFTRDTNNENEPD